MQYWYPTQSRVEALTCELATIEQLLNAHARDPTEYIPELSAALTRALKTPGFPKRQLRQWIWIASQFRLHRHPDPIGAIAGAALYFLEKRLSAGHLAEGEVQDLNWVLESTVQKIGERLGPQSLRSCLSVGELTRIGQRLASYDCSLQFDPHLLRPRIERQLSNLNAIAAGTNLTTLADKVEALFDAAAGTGTASSVARSALLYLADIPNVVPDSQAFLGLVDDIYVIEWAYAVVENQTQCLPLLEALIQKWPFIADLPILGAEPSTLDRYSQYVASACLYSLFENTVPSLLVVRESGAYALICAAMASIEVLRKEGAAVDLEVIAWPVGQPITISDGVKTFKALYFGRVDFGQTPKYRIGVRNGSITADIKRVLPYMARSATVHSQLSTGNDILRWLKEGHPDPLTHLTGSHRRRMAQQNCILLVGPRWKLELYISCLKPLSSSVAALFGVRYVTARHRLDDLSGSATDTPAIYTCSDVDTALDLIREPPDHVSGWHIIVDGGRNGHGLLSSLNSIGNLACTSFCVISELHEREAAVELLKIGVVAWYLEDQDVEAPPLVPKGQNANSDAVVRSISRQSTHWTVSKIIHDVRSEFLEAVANCMKERAASTRGEQPSADALDLQLSAFLQRAISFPIRVSETEKEAANLARRIASQASVLRSYDPDAGRIYELFKPYLKEAPPSFDREFELAQIAEELNSQESVAVVCRSARIADACSTVAAARPDLGAFTWLNLENLRQLGSFDRVIVPGWLDRMAMRELDNNGYGLHLDLLLLPFEQVWFKATVAASRSWERRLEAKTSETLRGLAGKLPKNGNTILWRDQFDQRIALPSSSTNTDEAQSDDSDIERLEARAIEALRQSIAKLRASRPAAKAQLVLFDDAGSYAFLPPTGKVIVLSPRTRALDELALARGEAEHLLFRSVTSLEPGMVLAFSAGGDRDLVDARADQFLTDPIRIRNSAALWKSALKRHVSLDHKEYSRFSEKLTAAGEPRAPATVRAWLTQTHTVAPMNFRSVIPLIASLTDDRDLTLRLSDVMQSIDLVYRARARAAETIVRELFSGKIDLDSEELSFELGGNTIRYHLHRISRLAGIQEVPVEIIGKVGHLGKITANAEPEAAL